MRARYLWVVLLALVFPVGLAACSSGALSSATTAPPTTAPPTTGPATTAAAPALNGAFNNVGISDDANPAVGNLDGGGYSYSAQALAAADLTPGASVAHDGLTFTWPDVAAGTPDNVLASGQTIAVSGSGTLGFLGASDYYGSSGTGTITYTDGTTQSFTLTLADWWANAAATGGDILTSVSYMNTATGQMNQQVSVYYAPIPLQAGKTMQSVTLPDVSQQAVQGSPAMHIFAISVSSPGGSGAGSSSGTGGYPYADAVCEFGSAGGAHCTNPSNSSELYAWGYWSGSTFEFYDQWGYEYRNCTSYVAWRLSAAGVNASLFTDLGNADTWISRVSGKPGVTVTSTPSPGDIAVWNSPGVGHVAWVDSVDGGTVTVSDYNYLDNGTYDQHTISSPPTDYIYFP
jgi:surface antigen